MSEQTAIISMTSELDALAHKIAFDGSASLVDSYSIPVIDGDETWQDISKEDLEGACSLCCLGEDGLDAELRYLELRGALIRHPLHPNWVQIGEPIEA